MTEYARITNGVFSTMILKVKRKIPGGIEGYIRYDSSDLVINPIRSLVKIRSGSYKFIKKSELPKSITRRVLGF